MARRLASSGGRRRVGRILAAALVVLAACAGSVLAAVPAAATSHRATATPAAGPTKPLDASTTAERVTGAVLDGLRLGLVVALIAVGMTMMFGAAGVVNLAQGELAMVGALVAWYLADAGLPLLLAGLIVALAGIALGVALDGAVWRPLRERRAGAIPAVVASLGLALLLRNIVVVVADEPSRRFAGFSRTTPMEIGPVSVLPVHLVVIGVAVVLLIAVLVGLARTRWGTAIRAVIDDRDLAAVAGLDVPRVLLVVSGLSTALATVGGTLLGVADGARADMGGRVLLLVLAAVALGGLGDAVGAVAGAVVVGLASELASLVLPDGLELVVAPLVVVAALAARPTGVLGRARRPG